MPPEGYGVITLSQDVLGKIDTHADHIGAETRAEAIRDLVNSDTQSIERRLAAIESVLDDVQQERSEGMVKRIERLEASVEKAKDDLQYVRAYVEDKNNE